MLISLGSISTWIFLEWGEYLVEVAGDAVVEAHAEGEEEVGLLDGVVDPALAVHAHHAEGERWWAAGMAPRPSRVLAMGIWWASAKARTSFSAPDSTMPWPARMTGRWEFWMSSTASRMGGAFRAEHGVGTIGVGLGGVEVEEGGGLLGVLGDVDEHGAGAAGAGDLKSLANGGGDVFGAGDKEVVLGDGQGDAGDVDLLEGVAAENFGRRPGR